MIERSPSDDPTLRLTLRPGPGRAPVTLRLPHVRHGDHLYLVPTSEGERWVRDAADVGVVGISLGDVDRIVPLRPAQTEEAAVARALLEERFGVVGDGDRAWPRTGLVFAVDLAVVDLVSEGPGAD